MNSTSKVSTHKERTVLYDIAYIPFTYFLIKPPLIFIFLALNYLINAFLSKLIFEFLDLNVDISKFLKFCSVITITGWLSDCSGTYIYDSYFEKVYTHNKMELLNNPVNPHQTAYLDNSMDYLFITISIMIPAILIILANYFLSTKLLKLNNKNALIYSVSIGVLTAPWLLLIYR